MAYWLMKTEPEEFSWDDQIKRGGKGEIWSGVRNFIARRNLKEMKKGEPWVAVTTAAIEPLPKPVTLAAVKAEPKLKDMALAKYARLSVQPVTDSQWKLVCKMGGL